jgi:hypothetical protein
VSYIEEGRADPSDYGRLCRHCVTLFEAFLEELQLFLDKALQLRMLPMIPLILPLILMTCQPDGCSEPLNAALDDMQRHLHRAEGAATQHASPDLVDVSAMLTTLETSARGWWRAVRHEEGVALTFLGVQILSRLKLR